MKILENMPGKGTRIFSWAAEIIFVLWLFYMLLKELLFKGRN